MKTELRNGFFSLLGFPLGRLTGMVCTEGVFLVLLIIGGGAAPQVAVLSPFRGAGVESSAVVGERQDTGLPVGIATVSLGDSYKHKQKGLGK